MYINNTNNIDNIAIYEYPFNWNEIFSNANHKNGCIPLDEFINIALYNDKVGYYINKNPIGKKGDFYTAPDLTNLFGETIATFLIDEWQKKFNKKKIRIVELGAGLGKMMYDIISVIQRLGLTEFFEYSIYEINPLLRAEQIKYLISLKSDIKFSHISDIDLYNISDVEERPIFFISNEFFDVLPIKQYIYLNNKWYEKYIALDSNNQLVEKNIIVEDNIDNISQIYLSLDCSHNNNGNDNHNNDSNNYIAKDPKCPKEGSIIEYSPIAIEYIKKIAKNINKFGGINLIIDYGYIQNEFRSTIRGYRKHKILDLNGILNNIFECDITADVNFNTILNTMFDLNNLHNLHNKHNNMYKSIYKNVYKRFCTQREFLIEYGILDRLKQIKSNINNIKYTKYYLQMQKIEQSVDILINVNSMGNKFKILYM